MKRVLSVVLSAALSLGLLTACGGGASTHPAASSAPGTQTAERSIVCTIFPEYDWVREILGPDQETFDLTMLLDSGTDLHSYQPTAEDILKISACDLLVYVGGESDAWVADALKETANPDQKVINLLDVLGGSIKVEEVREGMEAEEDAEKGGEEEPEYDEHVWLSLRNAQTLTKALCAAIVELDPEHGDRYQANCDSYCRELSALDAEYQKTAGDSATKTLLFGDRFPFRYLVDDYGLDYYAAFAGCSAETEASFETVVFLANKVDELGLHSVFTLENSDRKIAQTIINNTKEKNQSILALNSMQSTTAEDVEQGVTYRSIMEQNLETLKQGLK